MEGNHVNKREKLYRQRKLYCFKELTNPRGWITDTMKNYGRIYILIQ